MELSNREWEVMREALLEFSGCRPGHTPYNGGDDFDLLDAAKTAIAHDLWLRTQSVRLLTLH